MTKWFLLITLLLFTLPSLNAIQPPTPVDLHQRLKDKIRHVPDFPKPGIMYRDIGPLLADGPLFNGLISELAQRYRDRKVDVIVGLESRGFIFGAALANELKLPFVPARKPGKLPGQTLTESFSKEYGSDAFEIQEGLILPNQRVLIVDDIMATGGTATAACKLVARAGATVDEVTCIIDLPELGGKWKVPAPVHIVVPAS